MLPDEGKRVVSRERQPPRGPFVQHYAQGIQVSAPVDLPSQCLLGRDVRDRTQYSALSRQPRGHCARQTEVDQLGRTITEDQHVLWLEVTVDNALGVGMLQRGTHLAGDGQDLVQASRGTIVKRIAHHQLHHDEGHRAHGTGQLGLSGIVDRDNVGVVELGNSLGFAKQAGAAFGAQAGSAQHLDRDVSLQQRVVGAVDCAHATLTEFGVEAVTSIEQCAGNFGHAITPTS